MSVNGTGTPPDAADQIDLDLLLTVTSGTFTLPGASKRAGKPVVAAFTTVSRVEWLSLMPKALTDEEIGALTPEARMAHRLSWFEAVCMLCAYACERPKLTVEQWRKLGDDADLLGLEILVASELAERKESAPVPSPSVPAEGPTAEGLPAA